MDNQFGKIKYLTLLAIIAFSGSLLGQGKPEIQTGVESQVGLRTLDQERSGVILEDIIDIATYKLGPGDILGVNVVATDNMVFTLRVNPSGDLFIPTIGVLSVSGTTLDETSLALQDLVKEKLYINADVSVTLVDLRSFKTLVYGAVEKPGFITNSALSRVSDIINKAGGFKKYADTRKVIIHKKNGSSNQINIDDFLLNGNLDENPTLMEGDKLEVPFDQSLEELKSDMLNLTGENVLVTGFVNRPGIHGFNPGYTVRDYIGLSGGIHINGSSRGIELLRGDENIYKGDKDQIVMPGDNLNINPSLRYRMFGNYNIMQMVTSFMSIYLSYLAANR